MLLACILDHIVHSPVRVGSGSLPSFHILGLYVQLLIPVASLSSVSIYPPTSLHDPSAAPTVPNLQNILDSVLKTKSNALVVVPAFLEQWVHLPNAADVLKTLEYVVCPNFIRQGMTHIIFDGRSLLAVLLRPR